MKREMICIVCPAGCRLTWEDGKVSGYSCPRGLDYATTEMTAPKRNVSSTVILERVEGHPRIPVKTDRTIDKALVKDAVKLLDGIVVKPPVQVGDVILENVLDSGVNFVATRDIE